MPPFVCSRPPAVSWKSVPFQVILPFGYVLLRAPSLPSPLDDLSVRALPAWGLGPLHDLTRRRPRGLSQLAPRDRSRGFPGPHSVPSSGVLSLSTVSSATELAGLFHPAAMFRTHPVQGPSLSAQPCRLVADLSCPLAVVRRTTHRSPGAHDSTPRLRGLAPRWSRVAARRVIHSTSARSPLQVLCSSRLLPLRAIRARLPSAVRS